MSIQSNEEAWSQSSPLQMWKHVMKRVCAAKRHRSARFGATASNARCCASAGLFLVSFTSTHFRTLTLSN